MKHVSCRNMILSILSPLYVICSISALAAAQQEVTTSLNIPQVDTANVTPGATSATITFNVADANSFALNLVVPVDGASFVLLNPALDQVLSSADASVEFMAGTDNPATEHLPGGIFNTQMIVSPENGIWTLNFSFPAASEATVIIATLYADMDVQVGLILLGDRFVVGQEISAGLIVLDKGTPIAGLAPELTITPIDPPGDAISFLCVDTGQDADASAQDGIYSSGIAFQTAGEYTVSGEVVVDGVVRNVEPRTVQVEAPAFSMPVSNIGYLGRFSGQISPTFEFECLDRVNVYVQFLAWASGDAVVKAFMKAPNGNETSKSSSIEGIAGSGFLYSDNFSFYKEDLLDELGAEGPYTLSRLEIYLVDDNGIVPGLIKTDLGETVEILEENWCRSEALEIGNPDDSSTGEALLIEPVILDGFIQSLNVTFPVNIPVSGPYIFSFKLIGQGGVETTVAATEQTLDIGPQDIEVNIPASDFLSVDGPYSVVALLVTGVGGSGILAELGTPFEALRWQFLPTIAGDLDNDGDVDAEDRAIALSFRQQAALAPGDRRDLNGDGVINVLDARIFADIRCALDDCLGGEGEGEGEVFFKDSTPTLTDRQKQGL